MKTKSRKVLVALIMGMLLALCLTATVSAAPKNKIVTKNGKQYYYNASGKVVKGKYGYKIKNNYYKISKTGVLTKISEAQGRAGMKLNSYYGKQTKAQLLWKAFQISAKIKYYPTPSKIPSGQNRVTYYGLYGFKYNKGDCNVQAATFYWMAKAIGYNPKFVRGYVPQAVNSAGKPTKFGSHAWVTIVSGGKTRVFDPNFSFQYKDQLPKGLKCGYNFTYGTKSTYRYFNTSKKEIKK